MLREKEKTSKNEVGIDNSIKKNLFEIPETYKRKDKILYDWFFVMNENANPSTYEAFNIATKEGKRSGGVLKANFGTWREVFGNDAEVMQQKQEGLLIDEYKRELITVDGKPCIRDSLPTNYYLHKNRMVALCVAKDKQGNKEVVSTFTATTKSPYRAEHEYICSKTGEKLLFKEPDMYKDAINITDLSIKKEHRNFLVPPTLYLTIWFGSQLKYNKNVPDEARINIGYWVGPKINLRIYERVAKAFSPTNRFDGQGDLPVPHELFHGVEMYRAHSLLKKPAKSIIKVPAMLPYVAMLGGTDEDIKKAMKAIKQET